MPPGLDGLSLRSSKWSDRLSQALGLRLAAWYLATFLASTLVIGGLTCRC